MLATGLAFALPIAIVAAYFALNNALDELRFDAFTYNMLYVNVGLRGRIIDGFFGTLAIMQLNPLLWSAALITVVDLARTKGASERWLPLFWLGGGLLGVFASGHYGLHYYIPVLAPLALLAGKLVGDVVRELSQRERSQWTQPLALFAIAFLLWSGINYAASYLTYYRDDSRVIGDSFREAVAYLQQHTDEEDLIFIWGKEPQIYFEANRRAASKYINYYPMTRNFYVYPDAEARLTEELTKQEVEMLLVELPPVNPIPPPPFLQKIIADNYRLEVVVGGMEMYRLVR